MCRTATSYEKYFRRLYEINPIALYEMRIDKKFDTIVLYFAALRTWPDQLTDSSGHNVQIQPSASLTAHS